MSADSPCSRLFKVCVLISSIISTEGAATGVCLPAASVDGGGLHCDFGEDEIAGDLSTGTVEAHVTGGVSAPCVGVGVDRRLLNTSPSRPGGVDGVRGVGNVEQSGVASIPFGVNAVRQSGVLSNDSSCIVISAVALVFPLVRYCLRVPSVTIVLICNH